MPETSKDIVDRERMNQYASLLEEIKRRTTIIRCATQGSVPLDPRSIEEICVLNLRMICELLALGCLVVHGDIVETSKGKLKDAYQADLIINKLEKLHPAFFPIPGRQVVSANQLVEVINIESGFLSKPEFIALYRRCGQILHIGSLPNLSVNWNRSINIKYIENVRSKIITLLDNHRIALVREGVEIWAIMSTGPENNHAVQVVRMEKVSRSPRTGLGLPILFT